MRLPLRAAWDGEPLPAGLGGHAAVTVSCDEINWSWDVALPAAPAAPDAAPGFLDGLWEHDAVELFLTRDEPGAARPRYVELEAGPFGHWLALAFQGARERAAELASLDLDIRQDLQGTRWSGRVAVALRDLAPWLGGGAASPLRGMAALCVRPAALCAEPPVPGAEPRAPGAEPPVPGAAPVAPGTAPAARRAAPNQPAPDRGIAGRLLSCSQPLPGARPDFHRPAAWMRLTAGRAAGPASAG